jgi:hypothetical protein
MNQLAWDTIVAAAKELDCPTEGDFAQSLWILCNGICGLNSQEAAQLYRECGYVPFANYPLTPSAERIAA